MQRSMRRMNMPENWMFKSGGSFKTLIAEKLCPLDGNIWQLDLHAVGKKFSMLK